ncbi:hypothetical protein OESDEN_07335 [Oesophagostomum dentatum]|uniref:Peptidase M12A domain-containing protein n=1 Tax=Oesophagostomum dentatum TaxID=61180 RepID=A0A0B1TAD5_OESDE|nr:hypothetical protein OESDEN_07335 [Oesophagostomum dentatum]
MHYSKNAAAKRPGSLTLETLDKYYQDKIGRQEEPSKGDYMKVCKIYNCDVCMGKRMVTEGIVQPGN